MLYNPHCAPLFSSNYMLASQLQKMCFVTPIASYLSLVRDTNKHPNPSMSRPLFRHMPRFPARDMHGCCDWPMSRETFVRPSNQSHIDNNQSPLPR